MSTPAVERRRVYPDVDQFLLRAMVVIGAMTAVVAAQAAGARPAGWEQYLVLGLALLTAFKPESTAGFALLAGAAYVWARGPETLSPLVLLAVAGMVLAHVAALLAAQGPARMRVDGVQVRRWAGRALLLWLTAAAVWLLTVTTAEMPPRRWVYALGLTLVIVVVVAATRMISSRPGREVR